MVRALALGLAVLTLFPVAVCAHGPSRQKVTETVEINAPPEKVWKVIGNFQDMSWHPAVAKLEGQGGNDVNATRTLTLRVDPVRVTCRSSHSSPQKGQVTLS